MVFFKNIYLCFYSKKSKTNRMHISHCRHSGIDEFILVDHLLEDGSSVVRQGHVRESTWIVSAFA